MRKSLASCLSIICVTCYFEAKAQVAEPPKPVPTDNEHIWSDHLYRWWWSDSPTQVRDHILLEPGWQLTSLVEDEYHDPDFRQMSAYSGGEIVLLFSFYKDQLYRRAYDYPQTSKLAGQWNTTLKTLSFNERESYWLDKEHNTEIKRVYTPNRVMFIATIHSATNQTQK